MTKRLDWRALSRGQPRERNTREEVARIKARISLAKATVFERIDEALWQHRSIYGTYIIENTFMGPLHWRARRNGTLVTNGMTKSMDEAKIAAIDDIKRRQNSAAASRTLGSLSSG